MLVYFGFGLTLLFLVVRLVILFGIPVFGFKGEIEIHRASVLRNFSTYADLKKSEIIHWFDERRNNVKIIVNSNIFRAKLAEVFRAIRRNGRAGPGGKELLRNLQNNESYRELSRRNRLILDVYSEYETIQIADAKSGTVVISTDEKDVGTKFPGDLMTKIISGSEEKIFFAKNPGSDRTHIYFIHPVREAGLFPGGDGKIPGFMIFKVNHEDFFRSMFHTGEGLGKSGEVVLVNADRRILGPLKYPLRDGKRPNPLDYRLTTKPAELAAWGIDGTVFAEDYRGVPVLAVVRHARITSDFGIGMIVKSDRDEIYEPVRQAVIHSTAVSMTGLLVMLGLIYLVSGRLSQPIERLGKIAKRIEEGDLGARADFVSGDEVGALARSFNSMMERVQRWHEELDDAVKARTSQLSEANRELESEIVERARIETDLLHAKEYVENLIETANAMIVCLDTSGAVAVFNRTAERITGYDRKEIAGRNWFEAVVPKDRYPSAWEEFHRLLGGGTPETFENPVLAKSGEERLITWQNNVISEEGRVIGIVSFGIDITEQSKAEREKEKLEEQLRHIQKLEAVGTLAGGVAHDFNNILSAVIGFSHLALMKMKDDDPARHYIEQVLESSQRATVLTQSLLAFSRKQPVNLVLLDLNGLIKRFEKIMLRLIREDIEMTTACAPAELSVLADAGQMEQVLMNLVTNARDAMAGGGKLAIETRRAKVDDAFVEAHGYGNPGEYALLSVSDTGCGMDEKTRKHIFEPFFTTKERGKGTGLGLAMVYGIVKKHEGFINVYSEPGRGTIFRIYLPLAREQAGSDESSGGEPASAGGGTETILVAEDDADLLKLAVSVLGQSGYEVIEAVDGEDAVRKYAENADRIHLVILDGIMPRKNGKEAYEEMKKLRPEVKALFISGYAEDVFTKDGILQKGVAFVSKPVSPSGLLKKIRDVLD
jgi:PAS domain S-box-containing protein